jgi:putative CocE/NonD family hydrolase
MFHLRSGGGARTRSGDGVLSEEPPATDEPADTYIYDPADPTPAVPGRPARPFGSVDQGPIEDRQDVLVYSTPPLERDVDVIGPVEARLWAASSGRDTDWFVKLVDVAPDGRVDRLVEGMIRARYRDSASDPTPLEPDRVYEYRIDVGPVGARFRAGHRIRVEIASASFPQFDRNMNTGAPFGVETSGVAATQRVLHDAEHPSHVVLPIVPS